MNPDQLFSRTMKLTLTGYMAGTHFDRGVLESHLEIIQKFNIESLHTDDEKTAFWINVYNGMTNYQIVKNRLRKSVREKAGFFTTSIFKLGGYEFSLDDIEHGILRLNRGHPESNMPQFSEEDRRIKLLPQKLDYRIHFALNCGGLSCPPIAYYNPDLLNEQLGAAEYSFVSSQFKTNHSNMTIECSAIFEWYRSDFENLYLNDPKLTKYHLTVKRYNWNFH